MLPPPCCAPQAREAGHEVVSLIDAADMKAYLTGEKDSSEYIDITMVGQAVPVPSARAAGGEPSAKRRRGAEDADARSAKKDAGVVEVHPLHEVRPPPTGATPARVTSNPRMIHQHTWTCFRVSKKWSFLVEEVDRSDPYT